MKKAYVIAGLAVILTALMIAFPPPLYPAQPLAVKTISVPVTVLTGDTLNGICSRMALKYGDVRSDLREITYSVKQLNGKTNSAVYAGETIIVELVVPDDTLAGR